jgi:aminoglycoside 6'-N-acetyltransferase
MKPSANGATITSFAYSFRPASHEDLILLRRWLQTPEVILWWGDPEEQLALIEEDLDVPDMAQWIVAFESRPFAYVQAYEVHVWPQIQFDRLPPGAMAVDAFIGEPDMIGRGHGSKFLRQLAEHLTASGAPIVAIDPDIDNIRARRAYENAGFRGDAEVNTDEGPAILMIFDKSQNSKATL